MRRIDATHCLLERDGHSHAFATQRAGDSLHVFLDGEHVELLLAKHAATQGQDDDGRHYRAPMNGRIVSVSVKAGDSVQKGDTLLVMEAMKMEHRIRAHAEGVVAGIAVAAGDLVSEGHTLVDVGDAAA